MWLLWFWIGSDFCMMLITLWSLIAIYIQWTKTSNECFGSRCTDVRAQLESKSQDQPPEAWVECELPMCTVVVFFGATRLDSPRLVNDKLRTDVILAPVPVQLHRLLKQSAVFDQTCPLDWIHCRSFIRLAGDLAIVLRARVCFLYQF